MSSVEKSTQAVRSSIGCQILGFWYNYSI